jgi:hypothetical protein
MKTIFCQTPNEQKPTLTDPKQTESKTCLPNEKHNLPKPQTEGSKPILRTYKTNHEQSRRKEPAPK